MREFLILDFFQVRANMVALVWTQLISQGTPGSILLGTTDPVGFFGILLIWIVGYSIKCHVCARTRPVSCYSNRQVLKHQNTVYNRKSQIGAP